MLAAVLLGAVGVSGYSMGASALTSHSAFRAGAVPRVLMQQQPSGLGKPTTGPLRDKAKPLPEKSKAAEVLEEAKKEEEIEFDNALAAAAEKARSADALDAERALGASTAAALRESLAADGESALARTVAGKGSKAPTGKLFKALKKPKGTMSVICEGAMMETISLGGFELNEPSYISQQSREGGCAAVSVRMSWADALSADALGATVAEQETARGEFPSPIGVIVRGPIVDDVQLAAASAAGAAGVVVPLALSGREKTAVLLDDARAYGLEPLVRVCTTSELADALAIDGVTMVLIGDCTLEEAGALAAQVPAGVLAVSDVPFLDVRGAWMMVRARTRAHDHARMTTRT